MIPDSFEIMSEDMIKAKYPLENRPTIVYTNESGSINVALHYTESTASRSDLPSFLDVFKTTYENLYPSAQWYRSDVTSINGKDVGVMKLLTPAIDTEIYNLIWFSDVDGKLLLLTFNCTVEENSRHIEIYILFKNI